MTRMRGSSGLLALLAAACSIEPQPAQLVLATV
jgi:hypothetical protein